MFVQFFLFLLLQQQVVCYYLSESSIMTCDKDDVKTAKKKQLKDVFYAKYTFDVKKGEFETLYKGKHSHSAESLKAFQKQFSSLKPSYVGNTICVTYIKVDIFNNRIDLCNSIEKAVKLEKEYSESTLSEYKGKIYYKTNDNK